MQAAILWELSSDSKIYWALQGQRDRQIEEKMMMMIDDDEFRWKVDRSERQSSM